MSSFCTSSAGLVQFIGYLLLVFKIAIPVIIIILGAIDFGKSVVADDDSKIKKTAKQLLIRAIAGVCIFFLPNLVLWIFGLVKDFDSNAKDTGFENCKACLLQPTGNDCKSITNN